MTKIFTTPIFYANGEPHLGHAYSSILADIFHRYSLLANSESCLITGTDEHGLKIAQAASKSCTEVEDFVDRKSASFAELWSALKIEPDIFIRTTDRFHAQFVEKVWKKLRDKGDIYLGNYQGQYCIGCEQFYNKRDLVDEKYCAIHKTEVQFFEEETYLFRLSRYREQLLEFYTSNQDFIIPTFTQDYVVKQLKEEPLEDLSVSRINHKWGIPVPGDENHTIYVWIDALFSYLSAIQKAGYNPDQLKKTTHILGKDILKFHAIYWPAFLLALELPLPKHLIVHGWWKVEGHKISKSIPETVVHPKAFQTELSNDGLRYALIKQKPLFRDGDLVQDSLKHVINADLVNNFANLVKRNNTLILKQLSGEITGITDLDIECRQIVTEAEVKLNKVIDGYQAFDILIVSQLLNQILTELNRFFHERSPWLINKGLARAHVSSTCFVVANVVREVAILYSPIIPSLSESILNELGDNRSASLERGCPLLRDISINKVQNHFTRV